MRPNDLIKQIFKGLWPIVLVQNMEPVGAQYILSKCFSYKTAIQLFTCN